MTERHKCGRCDRQTTDMLCGGCIRHAQRVLDDIRGLVRDLDDTVSRQSRGAHLADVRPRGRKATPLPYADGPRLARAREDLDTLVRWAAYASGKRLSVAGGEGRQPTLEWAHAINTLRASAGWFRISSQAVTLVGELQKLRGTLRAAVDRPPTVTYLGRCGAPVTAAMLGADLAGDDGATITLEAVDTYCDSALGEVLADDTIKCRGCGKLHTPGSRNATAVAAMYGSALPLDIILDALPHLIGHRPKPHTVRAWLRRGRLRPATWVNLTRGQAGVNPRIDEDGNLLYLADDVLALVHDAHPGPGPRRKDVPA